MTDMRHSIREYHTSDDDKRDKCEDDMFPCSSKKECQEKTYDIEG